MIEILFLLFLCYIWLFITSIVIKDNSIVDVFWWIWFLIISSALIYQNQIFEISQIVTYFLIFFWSLRISASILRKKLKHKTEDTRYAVWRDEWKYFYTRSFFQVYLLQMFLLVLVAIPLFVIFVWEESNVYINFFWVIVSTFGLIYETIADIQVQKYIDSKNKKKNTIFTGWLWKYSRHPNYFWEIFFWFGITIISIQFSFYWWIWFFVIGFLLLFVSWIPLKEKSYKNKINYEEYIEKTPIFIPKYKK
jgi:steroid 5-alpha reductase family enzyme